MQVHYFHSYKPPDISFQPAAHIIDHCHILYIFTVFCVGYIYFWFQIECINEILMWIISIMYYCWSWYYMLFQSCIHSFGTWFSMTADNCQHILTGINSYYNAYLGFGSINKYAIGEANGMFSNVVPLFSRIALARMHTEISNIQIKVLRESDKAEHDKWEQLYIDLKKLNFNLN